MDNRERAKARNKKQETKFAGIKTWKSYSGGENMRNASHHQGENERQLKKKGEQEHVQHFLHKTCN